MIFLNAKNEETKLNKIKGCNMSHCLMKYINNSHVNTFNEKWPCQSFNLKAREFFIP